jgi:P63C domain.
MDEITQIHRGVLKLDNYDISCYVVTHSDGTEIRVLSQSEVVKLISGGRDSGNLQRYLSSAALQTTLPHEISNNYEDNLMIINSSNGSVKGVKASIVVDICNAYLKARSLGLLKPNQLKLAEQSEIFISALAKTGIDALIDEATGYQYFRKANDLQAKFVAYISEGYRKWTETFPREFFMHLYRLEGATPPLIVEPYPKRFGKYVMQFVYDTMDPEIADYLRKNNPNPSGKKHHHQRFTDYGYKALTDHLFSVLGVAKASPNMEKFKENLAFAFPNARTQQRIRFLENKRKKLKQQGQTEFKFDYLPNPNNTKQQEIDFNTNFNSNDPTSDLNQKSN